MFIFLILLVLGIAGALIYLGFRHNEPEAGLIFGILALLFGGAALLGAGHGFYNEHTETCTITEKDRGGDTGSHRVYTEECGVLANTDSIARGKFNSADVWSQLKVGETYELRIVGWRFEPFSVFPNILRIESEVN